MTPAADVAAARRWFRLLGRQPIFTDDAIILADSAMPDVWDANCAFALSGAHPDSLLQTLETAMAHTKWRAVVSDALTDPAIEAGLALAGFAQGPPVIEMLATGAVASPRPLPSVNLAQVASESTWRQLADLIRIDHAEGKRTGPVSETAGEGLIAMMRQRTPEAFSLIRLDGEVAGYGMTIACPGGLGLIESLFTLPQARGQGVMSAYIVAAAAALRRAGCDRIFLDAHAHDTPRLLYHRLGFSPVAIWRYWTRQVTAGSD